MSGYRFYRNQALEVGFEETLYPLPNPAGCPATRCPGLSMRDLAGNFHAAQETSPSSHRQAASRSATWAVPNMPLGRKGPCGNPFNQAAAGPLLEDALLRLVGNSTFSFPFELGPASSAAAKNAASGFRCFDYQSDYHDSCSHRKLVAVQFSMTLTAPYAVSMDFLSFCA